jgi:hypothetical protein
MGKIFFYIFNLKSVKKGAGFGSISQRYGSGSAPKCHGSLTLLSGDVYRTRWLGLGHRTVDKKNSNCKYVRYIRVQFVLFLKTINISLYP